MNKSDSEKIFEDFLKKRYGTYFCDGVFKKKRSDWFFILVSIIFLLTAFFLPKMNYENICPDGKYVFDEDKTRDSTYDDGLKGLVQMILCSSSLEEKNYDDVVYFDFDNNSMEFKKISFHNVSNDFSSDIENEDNLKIQAVNFFMYFFYLYMVLTFIFLSIFSLSCALVKRLGDFLIESFLWALFLLGGSFSLALYLSVIWGLL